MTKISRPILNAAGALKDFVGEICHLDGQVRCMLMAVSAAVSKLTAGDPDASPSLTRYCRWADNLEEQFACARHLVENESATAEEHSALSGKYAVLAIYSVESNGVMIK